MTTNFVVEISEKCDHLVGINIRARTFLFFSVFFFLVDSRASQCVTSTVIAPACPDYAVLGAGSSFGGRPKKQGCRVKCVTDVLRRGVLVGRAGTLLTAHHQPPRVLFIESAASPNIRRPRAHLLMRAVHTLACLITPRKPGAAVR